MQVQYGYAVMKPSRGLLGNPVILKTGRRNGGIEAMNYCILMILSEVCAFYHEIPNYLFENLLE